MLDLGQSISRGLCLGLLYYGYYGYYGAMGLNAEVAFLGKYIPLFGVEC